MKSKMSFVVFAAVSGILVLLYYSCFIAKGKESLIFVKTVRINDTFAIPFHLDRTMEFHLYNTDTTPVSFWVKKTKGVNYRNAATILSSTLSDTMDDKQKAFALWNLVSKSSFHYSFPYNHSLKDNVDPMALVTFPYLLCGEKTGILINLATIAGLKARAILLQGHIVAELFYANQWHMFDADENVVFFNNEKEPASASELSAHLDWISSSNLLRSEADNLSFLYNYKRYFRHFKLEPKTVCYNFQIANYRLRNMDITLHHNDTISYYLYPTSFLKRFFFPRYTFESKGIMKRKLSLQNKNFSHNGENKYEFNEHIPYYIKSIQVAINHEFDCETFLFLKSRIDSIEHCFSLGNFNQQHLLSREINAPASPDIYYDYRLSFICKDSSLLNHITVSTTFEFNAISFPLGSKEDVTVAFFKGSSVQLSVKSKKN